MWQVSGRSNITDFEEVVELDREYISHWNMGLDLLLVVRLNIEIDLENNFPCAVPLWRSICSSGFDNSADVPADSDQRIWGFVLLSACL